MVQACKQSGILEACWPECLEQVRLSAAPMAPLLSYVSHAGLPKCSDFKCWHPRILPMRGQRQGSRIFSATRREWFRVPFSVWRVTLKAFELVYNQNPETLGRQDSFVEIDPSMGLELWVGKSSTWGLTVCSNHYFLLRSCTQSADIT